MPETILVTGASGYIAAHVLEVFLAAGYHVRGAVRAESSAAHVKQAHSKYGDALSFVIVPDMTAPGAFDEAVKGVNGIIHTASPFILDAKDYDKELFEPAVKGTVDILEAAKEKSPSVKRVVITSSFAAVLDSVAGTRPGYTYTEKDWNPMTAEEARKADPTAAYLVSKTLAERAAYDFVEKEKPAFSITTLDPPMVYGPILHEFSSMSKLNTSSADIYRLFNGTTKEVPPTAFYGYVDVRDLAKAHLLAYESEAAANQRYIVAASGYTYQQVCDIIRKKFPELVSTTPEGEPNQPLPDTYKISNAKIKKDLGIDFLPMEKTFVDTVEGLRGLEAKLGSP